MKTKKIMIGYLILLIIIALPLTIYGGIKFKKLTTISTDTPSASSDASKENSNGTEAPTTAETPAAADRFAGKNLVIPAGIPVLCYHAFGDDSQVTYISEKKFREQMQYLKDNSYFTLTLDEFNDFILNKKPIPEHSVLITIDDGYMNNYQIAYPILKELGLNATIFIITNGINDGYYMSADQLVDMSKNGISFGSHTTNHQQLDKLTYEEQLKIMQDSKTALENILGTKITAFCYPFGKFNENSKKAAKESGYSTAFNINGGFADLNDNPLNIDRQVVLGNYDINKFISLFNVK